RPNQTPLGMTADDLANLAEKEGWLVEVRGYTYHHKGVRFVLDTLVQNINDRPYLSDPKKSAAKAAPKKEGDEPTAEPEKPKPAENRVSHVFIYSYEEDKSPEPIPNKVINKSALRDMIQPPKPKEGEPENQQPLGLGNRSRWQPLGGTGPE